MAIQTSQAVRIYQYGGPEQLKLERVQRPEPQQDEVLIRVHAAAVNPVDWKITAGMMKAFRPVQFPYIPGRDIAGVVEEVGPGVTTFEKGQEVFGQSTHGGYAEYITASVSTLALKPDTLSFDEAAAIPVGATTAWQGLFDHGGLLAGQRVLVQGAAGGVGQFAIQFARWKGAHVIGTTSTANVEFVRALGAEMVIDYTTTSVEQEINDTDLVFDTVGSSTLDTSLQAVKPGGTLVSIAGQPSAEKVRDRNVRFASFSAQVSSELLRTFAQLIDDGQVKVAVGTVLPLSNVSQAHELSQKGHGRGRIVLHIA